jgi:hypothetical protein
MYGVIKPNVMNSQMTSAWNTIMSAVKLPGKVKQNNLPPECGQPIDVGEYSLSHYF